MKFGCRYLCVIFYGICVFFTMADIAAAETMILVSRDNTTIPVIVIGVKAGESEKYAAQEMAAYLEKITGKSIPIVDDGNIPENKIIISLGRNRLTESIDTSKLGHEQYITDIQPDKLIIIGGHRDAKPGQCGRDAGILYGVYEFLDMLGVRWYRPEPWGEHVPKINEIKLEVGRVISPVPSYPLLRAVGHKGLSCYGSQTTENEKVLGATWCIRNRMNYWADTGNEVTDAELHAKFGGRENYEWNHMHHKIIPPKKYFSTHPEYFALINGKRNKSDLCLGNPELQSVFAGNLIAKAKKHPYLTTLSVEPNDCKGNSCQCDLCKAMDLPLNTRIGGEGSNRLAAFNSIVARRVGKEVPWVKLMWLGYSSHAAAPTNIKQLEPNTIIMPAPINTWSDWTKNLMDMDCRSGEYPKLIQTIRNWASLKPSSLMVWEYFDGYGWPGPLPITYTVADRWRHYRKLGIKGIYNLSYTSWGPQGLDRYMSGRLAWNPDFDVDKELNLYYTNYYGPAAKPMKAYHELLFQAFKHAKYPVYSGGRGMHLIFTPRLIQKLGAQMKEAQRLVKDHPLYERRLKGVWAGYEFSRRISDILMMKKKYGISVFSDGTAVSSRADMSTFEREGSYLYSEKAEKAYSDLLHWVRDVNSKDWIFEGYRTQTKEDPAETIFPKGGEKAVGCIWMCYLPYDVLLNRMNWRTTNEDIILRDFK